MTFSLAFDGREYFICGDDAFSAIRHNMKYIEKLAMGCTIKHWQIIPQSENAYIVALEYYMKPPGRVRNLKTKPPVHVKQLPLTVVDDHADGG